MSLLRALTLLLAMLAPAGATVTNQAPYDVTSADWTSLGAGPLLLRVQSGGAVYVAAADAKPGAGEIGTRLDVADGIVRFSSTSTLWARATAALSPSRVKAMPAAEQVLAAGAQKQTFTVTIASGQTVSGAVDLGTARLWAIVTPATLTATAVTFLASADCSTYSALYDSGGTVVAWTVAAGRYILNADPARWLSVRCVKLAIVSSEGADRAFTIEAVP